MRSDFEFLERKQNNSCVPRRMMPLYFQSRLNSFSPDSGQGLMNLPRLLIVDDEMSVRESLKFVFSKGFSVFEANSLETAIAKVRDTRPAVVLLDILMPRTDGIEVLRQIKAIHPGCEVIMLTALSNRQIAAKATDFGAFDLVGKPFDVVDLLAKVNSALAKASVQEKAALPQT